MKTNYTFIGDIIDFENSEKFDLGFNHFLRRPNLNEITAIQNQLKRYFGITTDGFYNRYEQLKTEESPTGFKISRIDTPNKFKYSVIQQPINYVPYHKSLALTLNICEFDLTQIFSLQYATQKNPKTGEQELSDFTSVGRQMSHSMYNYFDLFSKDFSTKKMTPEIAAEIRNLHSEVFSFLEVRDKFPHVYKAISDFSSHKEISRKSPFKLIVLISCLEGLITDGSHDRINSINRQLQSKLNLINNRINNPVNFTNYIKGPDTLTFEKVIEKIYTYRSKIAHGDIIEFTKSLEVLKKIDFDTIIEFILELSKKVMRFAINEPKLIIDLKKI